MDTDHDQGAQQNERYDPWRHLQQVWPEIQVVVEPMHGRLLGWIRYPVIGLRAGMSGAQRRCTLAHEIVHLERGITDCGRWAAHEERHVHSVAARRLIRFSDLARAVSEFGPADHRMLAHALDVDRETLQVRLGQLTEAELRSLAAQTGELWSVA